MINLKQFLVTLWKNLHEAGGFVSSSLLSVGISDGCWGCFRSSQRHNLKTLFICDKIEGHHTCCGLARAMSPGPEMFNSLPLLRLRSLLPGRSSSRVPGRFNSLGPGRFWKPSLVPEMLSSLATGRFWKLMLSLTSSNLTRISS